MKNLFAFINEASRSQTGNGKSDGEYEVINDPNLRSKFGKIELIDPNKDLSDQERKIIAQKAARAKHARGKEEKEWTKNGATWAIDPPYEDGAVEDIPDEDYNDNLLDLQAKFDADEPFFIQGRAGWGKTSIIEDMAKRAGRHVITVYLDKAQATDLGGIPVPIEENGVAKIVNAMPDWAAYMLEHPKDEFLLFFDEMNQAQPDVMNALMPIVLKNVICNIQFDNFMVGAAGNFEEENESGVSELSGPLKSRFKPIIIWNSGSEDDWRAVFKYLHKKWDKEFGKEVINEFEKRAMLFDNPRELEHKVFKAILNTREKAKSNPKIKLTRYNSQWCRRRLEDIVKDELSRNEEKQLDELAEIYHKLLVEGPQAFTKQDAGNSRTSRSKGSDQVSEEIKKQIKNAMKRGYMVNDERDSSGNLIDKRKYGISRENINVFCDMELSDKESGEVVNKEMLERIINKLEADGVKFKYETNAEWKKDGLSDPYED